MASSTPASQPRNRAHDARSPASHGRGNRSPGARGTTSPAGLRGGNRSSHANGRAGSSSPRHDPLSRELRPAGPVQLDVGVYEEADATVVAVAGELDILTAPRLAGRLDEVIRRTAADIVVDLRDTAFIDSSGLHILLNTVRRMTRQSRGFAVICGPGPVRRLIERARLIETLGVVSGFAEYERRATRG